MARNKKYTDKQFIEAVKTSTSIAQVLKKLDLCAAGGNYRTAKLRIKELDIDNSHFTGQSYAKGTTHNFAKKTPLKDILIKNSKYSNTNYLKKRLLKDGVFDNKCYNCGLDEWLGEPVVCQLEHKNGDNTDNRSENLTLLCPNCHSQTKTFAGRNKKVKKRKYYCSKCGNERSRSSTVHCITCSNGKKAFDSRKVKNRPDMIQLLKEIKELGYVGTGKKYGVSDVAVRKWIKK